MKVISEETEENERTTVEEERLLFAEIISDGAFVQSGFIEEKRRDLFGGVLEKMILR